MFDEKYICNWAMLRVGVRSRRGIEHEDAMKGMGIDGDAPEFLTKHVGWECRTRPIPAGVEGTGCVGDIEGT